MCREVPFCVWLQDQTDMQQENAALKQRCLRLETEVRALRKDMVALQRHVHMPISVSTVAFDDDKPYHKVQVLVCCAAVNVQACQRCIDVSHVPL